MQILGRGHSGEVDVRLSAAEYELLRSAVEQEELLAQEEREAQEARRESSVQWEAQRAQELDDEALRRALRASGWGYVLDELTGERLAVVQLPDDPEDNRIA